jgi:uncharacterized protein with HEPN domain
MSPREWHLYVADILQSIEKVRTYVEGMNFNDFEADSRTVDAVVRNLEVIGEAARRIPDNFKAKHSDLDWVAMVGLRNRIAHEYFGLSLAIIWTIVERDLPLLEDKLRVLE